MRAAALWAAGETPVPAAVHTGYRARMAAGLRLSGPDDSILLALRQTRAVRSPTSSHCAIWASIATGGETWMVMAAPARAGADTDSDTCNRSPASRHPSTSRRPARHSSARHAPAAHTPGAATAGVATGQRSACQRYAAVATKSFGPAPPLRHPGRWTASPRRTPRIWRDTTISSTWTSMARRLQTGSAPPAIGRRLVGENIAYGPTSARGSRGRMAAQHRALREHHGSAVRGDGTGAGARPRFAPRPVLGSGAGANRRSRSPISSVYFRRSSPAPCEPCAGRG